MRLLIRLLDADEEIAGAHEDPKEEEKKKKKKEERGGGSSRWPII